MTRLIRLLLAFVVLVLTQPAFALAAALRADRRTRHVPLLGMTGQWTAEMQNDAQRAGFSDRDARRRRRRGQSAAGNKPLR